VKSNSRVAKTKWQIQSGKNRMAKTEWQKQSGKTEWQKQRVNMKDEQ
jgi:hypothetical protein